MNGPKQSTLIFFYNFLRYTRTLYFYRYSSSLVIFVILWSVDEKCIVFSYSKYEVCVCMHAYFGCTQQTKNIIIYLTLFTLPGFQMKDELFPITFVSKWLQRENKENGIHSWNEIMWWKDDDGDSWKSITN